MNFDFGLEFRKNPRILVVDDTPANIDVMRGILQDQGYEIAVALNGTTAIKVAERLRPDLILLDVMMPGIDGFDTCKALKAKEATKHIPIIFVTARTDTHDISQGFKCGAVDYISKPIKQEEVCARVRTHVEINKLMENHRAQAETFRAIVNNISEAIVIMDQHGIIRFINPIGEQRLLHYRDNELSGKSLSTILEPPFDDEYLETLKQAALGQSSWVGRGQREVKGRRKDGNSFTMDIAISEMFLAEPLYIGVLQDVDARKQIENELIRISQLDPLTNIENRRCFDQCLNNAWRHSVDKQQPISLIMIDVDYFKLYNDTYGHQAGDRCLQKVASTLKHSLNHSKDLVARYGGEEFVMVLPGVEISHGSDFAEKICENIVSLHIPHSASLVSDVVTISAGLATTIPNSVKSPQEFLKLADQALYTAKKNGRNQVSVAHEKL